MSGYIYIYMDSGVAWPVHSLYAAPVCARDHIFWLISCPRLLTTPTRPCAHVTICWLFSCPRLFAQGHICWLISFLRLCPHPTCALALAHAHALSGSLFVPSLFLSLPPLLSTSRCLTVYFPIAWKWEPCHNEFHVFRVYSQTRKRGNRIRFFLEKKLTWNDPRFALVNRS